MSATDAGATVLCRLDDIEIRDSKGFAIGEGAGRRKFFVVRDETGVYAYANACPHSHGPLEWVADQFLSLDRTHIQCTLHGAMFQIRDGLCIYGPCVGERLAPVKIAVSNGDIVLLE